MYVKSPSDLDLAIYIASYQNDKRYLLYFSFSHIHNYDTMFHNNEKLLEDVYSSYGAIDITFRITFFVNVSPCAKTDGGSNES